MLRQRPKRRGKGRPPAHLGPKGKLQRPGEFPRAAFTNDVVPAFLRLRNGRLARDRQTVLVNVDGDVFGCQTRELERCRHGIGVLGFGQVKSREQNETRSEYM